MLHYDSSDEEFEEDPDIPLDVSYRETSSRADDDDNRSTASDLSDQSMCGRTYDCKPDILEIAHLTLNVNYGDLANLAWNRSEATALDPLLTDDVNAGEELTWSQLLDGEPQPAHSGLQQSTKSFIWTQGYDPNCALSGGQMASPNPFSTPFKLERRKSATARLVGLPPKPQPLKAIRRFLIRGNDAARANSKNSSCTASTLSSSFRERGGASVASFSR